MVKTFSYSIKSPKFAKLESETKPGEICEEFEEMFKKGEDKLEMRRNAI